MQLEEKLVELRLGQGVSPVLLDGILRGEDKERLVQGGCHAADRHAVFFHRLQQRRLGLGGRPIDLVGQQQVGEQRPGLKSQALAVLVLHQQVRADDVGGHQVGGELHAAKLQVEHLSQRADEVRLADARHAFQEHVPSGQKRDQRVLDHAAQLDHDLLHLAADGGELPAEHLDGLGPRYLVGLRGSAYRKTPS